MSRLVWFFQVVTGNAVPMLLVSVMQIRVMMDRDDSARLINDDTHDIMFLT